MTETLKDNFERCCRLCAKDKDVTVMIFSQEAEAMLLQNKLNKYLLIEVEEDDKLPKNICLQCCTTLQTVCEFIDIARKSQDLLLERSLIFDDVLSANCMISSIKSEVKSEPENEHDDNDKFTELEVSVDPMMVLQNSEETLSPSNDIISIEDVTYMHSVDEENVTIKLIKKRDKTSKKSGDEADNSEPVKPFPCITCKRGFFTELALKSHSWQHTGENKPIPKYTCTTCSDAFNFKNDLITHLKQHRTNRLCQLCGRMFRTEKTYLAHMSLHSASKKNYTCKVCGRSYNTWGSLNTHSVTHSSERPYQCHFCKRSFKRNQDLKFHINQHTGAKPYKCPFCEKCFASSGNCYSHRNRMHPGKRVESKIRKSTAPVKGELVPPRPIAPKCPLTVVKGIYKYLCTMCNASFVKRDNFTYHMYQHTGEKPFQCSFCTEKFLTRRGLLLHHDKAHPGNNRPLGLVSKNVLLK